MLGTDSYSRSRLTVVLRPPWFCISWIQCPNQGKICHFRIEPSVTISHYLLVPLLASVSSFLVTVNISKFSIRPSLHSSHGGLFDSSVVQDRDSKGSGDEHCQSHLRLQHGRVNVHCWYGHQADDAGVPEKKAFQRIHHHVLA